MVTNGNPTDRSILGGSSTVASSNISIATGYLAQSTPFPLQGIDTLTEHVLVNIGTTPTSVPWANMIDMLYRTLQVNSNRVPSYSVAHLSAYVSFVQLLRTALCELQRDMKLGTLVDSYSLSLARDLYGEDYDAMTESFVNNRASNIQTFNFLLENYRNVYPCPQTSFDSLATYLLGNIFRDDETNRGQYVLFHSTMSVAQSSAETINTRMTLMTFAQRTAAIEANTTEFLSKQIEGKTMASVVAQIAADITKIYGAYAYWQLPIAQLTDGIVPLSDAKLFQAMYFDPLGYIDKWALNGGTAVTSGSKSFAIGMTSDVTATYPRYVHALMMLGTGITTNWLLNNQHIVLTQRSDGIAGADLAELMPFSSTVVNSGEIIYAASASGITPCHIWFNDTTVSASGAYTVTQASGQMRFNGSQNPYDSSHRVATAAAVMINGFAPVIQFSENGKVAILAEVDEVTNIEAEAFKNILTTFTQRYFDMFTMFQTKAPKVEAILKDGASALTIKQGKESGKNGK